MQTYRQSETGIQTDKDIERNTYVSNDRIPLYIHDASIHESVCPILHSHPAQLIHPSLLPSVRLSALSAHPLPHQFIHSFAHMSVNSSVHPVINSLHPSVYFRPSNRLSFSTINPSTHPQIFPIIAGLTTTGYLIYQRSA